MLVDKKLFLFDIDGTIALGKDLINGTLDLLEHIQKIGGKPIFITNNSTKSIKDYISQFKNWNIDTDESNFVTASYATALFLKEKYGDKKLFVIGTNSFISELKNFGLNVTEDLKEDIVCAVVGYDNELTYKKIEKVCELLQTKPVDYIGTNPDLCCPTKFGSVPDCGAICEMIACAVNRKPLFIGKPNKLIIEICLQLSGFSKDEALVVGDRFYTDIACGINSGVDTAVVFTGEAKEKDIASTEFKPTYQFDTVRELYLKLSERKND